MKEKIVIAAAHPDDVVGCAGFALLTKDIYDFYVLDFTRGERGLSMEGVSYPGTAAIRTAEEVAACAFIHAEPIFLGEINGDAFAGREVCGKIAELLGKLKPRAVLTHWPLDFHIDHVLCTAAVMKGMEMAKYECELYFYEETMQSQNFNPQYYVDITPVMEEKLRMIRTYACQNRNDSIATNKLRDGVFRGSQILVEYAEAYAAFRNTASREKNIFHELYNPPNKGAR